jgi:integrase
LEIFIEGAEEATKPVLLNNLIDFKSKDCEKSIPTKKGVDEEMKFKGITIFQNKNCKTWYARYRIDGKQYYISEKTQKKCYNLLKEKLNGIKPKKEKQYTLKYWYEKWLVLFKIGKVKERTLIDYKFMLKYVPIKILEKEISKISSLEIQELLKNIPYERQRQKVFEFLKSIFEKAQKMQVTENNIFVNLDKPKHIKRKGIALTQEQQKIYIKECLKEKEKNDIFLITLFQGLRKGEVLALTNEDLNFNKKTIRINKSLNQKNSFDTTKNLSSNRIIPMFDNSFQILKKYKNTKGRIFNFSNKTFQINFKKLLKNCNLPNEIRIHDLRHTFITNLKNMNIPEHIIQFYVGHEIGSEVTSKVYTHIDKEIVDKETKFINQKLNSNSTQKKED